MNLQRGRHRKVKLFAKQLTEMSTWVQIPVSPPNRKVKKMNSTEYDNYMCKKYPKIFRDRNAQMTDTCMCWGFNINEGWHELLNELCEKLQLLEDTMGIETIAAQVKEKFGGLRFYYDIHFTPEKDSKIWMDIISDLVSYTEHLSFHTCEKCGKHGEVRGGGWIKTLCDECADGRPKIEVAED